MAITRSADKRKKTWKQIQLEEEGVRLSGRNTGSKRKQSTKIRQPRKNPKNGQTSRGVHSVERVRPSAATQAGAQGLPQNNDEGSRDGAAHDSAIASPKEKGSGRPPHLPPGQRVPNDSPHGNSGQPEEGPSSKQADAVKGPGQTPAQRKRKTRFQDPDYRPGPDDASDGDDETSPPATDQARPRRRKAKSRADDPSYKPDRAGCDDEEIDELPDYKSESPEGPRKKKSPAKDKAYQPGASENEDDSSSAGSKRPRRRSQGNRSARRQSARSRSPDSDSTSTKQRKANDLLERLRNAGSAARRRAPLNRPTAMDMEELYAREQEQDQRQLDDQLLGGSVHAESQSGEALGVAEAGVEAHFEVEARKSDPEAVKGGIIKSEPKTPSPRESRPSADDQTSCNESSGNSTVRVSSSDLLRHNPINYPPRFRRTVAASQRYQDAAGLVTIELDLASPRGVRSPFGPLIRPPSPDIPRHRSSSAEAAARQGGRDPAWDEAYVQAMNRHVADSHTDAHDAGVAEQQQQQQQQRQRARRQVQVKIQQQNEQRRHARLQDLHGVRLEESRREHERIMRREHARREHWRRMQAEYAIIGDVYLGAGGRRGEDGRPMHPPELRNRYDDEEEAEVEVDDEQDEQEE